MPEYIKLYIAGKWDDKEIIREHMNQMESFGYQITHDWTKNESLTRNIDDLSNFAKLDIDGVINADIVLVIMTDKTYTYRGTFTELGASIATGKKIVIYCPDKDSYCCTNCFFHHPNIQHFEQWDEVLKFMKSQISN